jgi:hypothetical protein
MASKRKDDPELFNETRISAAMKELERAFPWCDTAEGDRYWRVVFNKLMRIRNAARRRTDPRGDERG